MSFYRIYRPTVIDEIDNVHVRERLLTFLKKEKNALPHAFLFSGPKGAGKTTAARIIAKLFNCTDKKTAGPCGICDQCRSIEKGTHMDVLEIDAASNRGIDDIRALREGIHLAPSQAAYKVYIIDEVHMLTTEAFNALLKTLEEPPSHAVFILATTDPGKVPVTVRSRCMELVFAKASKEELIHALTRIVKKEKISIDKDALMLIADMSDGAFRDAVKMLEQVSFSEGTVTKDMVRGLLSKTEDGVREEFLDILLSGGNKKDSEKKALQIVRNVSDEGKDIKQFTADCMESLQQALVDAAVAGEKLDTKMRIVSLIKALSESWTLIRTCPIASLPLELMVVEFLDAEEETVSTKQSSKSPVRPERADLKTIPSKREEEDQQNPQQNVKNGHLGMLSLEKLKTHWNDFIEALKPYNHSVAGVMRSARPKSIDGDTVVIEAYYKFHQERLSDPKVRDILASVLKKLFGENVRVEVVLGRK